MNPSSVTLAALIAAGLAFAARQTPIENEVKQVETLVNLRGAAAAINLYTADYDGVYPYPHDMKGLKWVVLPYSKDTSIWKTLNPKKGEVRFNMSLGGVARIDIKEPEKAVLLYESNQWPNRQRAVAFPDGGGRLLNPVQWGQHALSLASRIERKAERLPASLGKNWKEEKAN